MATTSLKPRLRGWLAQVTGRLRPVADDRRWLVPIGLALYVVAATWSWNFPNEDGIPFNWVWLVLAGTALVAWRLGRASLDPIAAAAIVAISAMVLTDVTVFWSQPLRDIELYVKAGDRWLAGVPVYMDVPMAVAPENLSDYPFLYPPLTLPLFGAFALMPFPAAAALWVTTSAAALLAGLRWVGLSWRWCLILLVWPPVFQGLFVGNVAVPLFALFAAAPWRPALLAIPPIFKLYSAIAALWLLRREHWRAAILGGIVVAGLCVVTLPAVGAELWFEWLAGLQAYQVSQTLLPNNLYGYGLARYMPLLSFIAIAVVVTVLALRARGRRDQLARLGVATLTGSPSLFSHGYLVAFPAMLRLDAPWFWLAFGLTTVAPGPAWFGGIAVIIWSWFEPSLRKNRGFDPYHPLGAAPGPWPGALASISAAPPRRQEIEGANPSSPANPGSNSGASLGSWTSGADAGLMTPVRSPNSRGRSR